MSPVRIFEGWKFGSWICTKSGFALCCSTPPLGISGWCSKMENKEIPNWSSLTNKNNAYFKQATNTKVTKTPRIHKTTKHSSQNSHKSSGNRTMTQAFSSCRYDTCWWIELRWIMDTPIHFDPFYPLDCFVGSCQSGTWCNYTVGNVNDSSVNKQFFATGGIHEGHWCLEWGMCHFCLWSFTGICSCQLCFKVRCGR